MATMEDWVGFTDEELRRMKQQNAGRRGDNFEGQFVRKCH